MVLLHSVFLQYFSLFLLGLLETIVSNECFKKLFQTNLIEKEKNIGGILNATAPIYRRSIQQYKSSAVSVRCLYKSNYEKKTLNIKCTQFFETTIIQLVLANGEIYIILRHLSYFISRTNDKCKLM